MEETRIQASVFKARCLSLLDEVETSHRTFVVTKNGRPVARLVPLEAPTPTFGSVVLLADNDEEYYSTDSEWDAER
ncbi:MAG: type II toxin-antitoxin system Phd/YefM family antitoxin [Acidimicrobiales bacterium]